MKPVDRVLTSALLVIWGIVAWAPAPAVAQAPETGAPTAEAPTFNVGDEWAFLETGKDNKWTRRVVAIEGELVVMTRSDRPPEFRMYLDRHLTLRKVEGGAGTIGWRYLDFPLSVGKSWRYRAEARNPRTGERISYDNRVDVLAYEDVTVPAGTFQAFKIRHRSSTRGWSGEVVSWYAPAVKATVKREDVSRNFWASPDRELVSYSLK